MDLFKQGMKGPNRPAPAVPFAVNRYSPVTNWNDDPFGADVFEPTPQFAQKKKPPPRPPPPKVSSRPPDVPVKPSHFIRKPTVLTSLLSRKNKNTVNETSASIVNQNYVGNFNSEIENVQLFSKCEPKQNIQTAALIDLSSPPSSPTFTTRSSSDGLSVDSFGSDATTSTNHHNALGGGNASQAESGFEDDFDLFLNSKKQISREESDDFISTDPFSPQPTVNKPPLLKKPVFNMFELNHCQPSVPLLKGPTIIRAKPARPKPPDSTSILKSTFGNTMPTTMNINTSVPIHKVTNGFGDSLDAKPFNWEHDLSPEREYSPPMPSIPPPPPPVMTDDDAPSEWSQDVEIDNNDELSDEKPYAIALFDYFTDHPDDLSFSANARIEVLRRIDAEWLFGRLRSGMEGLFPSNYVDIKVPLQEDAATPTSQLGVATALYDFEPEQPGDLAFHIGDKISVMYKLNDSWYFGECKGTKGQFPVNYVQMN